MPSSLFTEKVGLAIVGASRAEFGPTSMTKPVVVMAVPISPNFEAALAEKFNLLRLWQAEDKEEFLAKNANEIRGMVVIPAFAINKDVLCQLPKLEIVSTVSIGLDKIDLEACRERGIAVTNTPDVLTDEVADLAIALVLTTMRRFCAADRYVRQGLWPIKGDFPLTHKVSGKRMGILGLGRIGSAIAKRAESFGCSISYYSRAKKPVAYTHYESVAELAKNSDILVVACALTDGTFHLVNREVLDALGANGTLVNIARGAIVDEAELVSALLEGRLGAAGLDVFENEPHVPEALFGLENVVLLPHAGSATLETRSAMAGLVLGNLEAHFAGKPLLTPVN